MFLRLSIYACIIIFLIIFIWSNYGRYKFEDEDLAQNFNLDEYIKVKWYQYKFIPNPFQKMCKRDVTADYLPSGKYGIKVINTCYTKDDKKVTAKGYGYPLNCKLNPDNNKLKVSFAPYFLTYIDKALQSVCDMNFVTGDYYVIRTDNKTYSMVGSADRKYLWILTNKKDRISGRIYKELVKHARSIGFNTDLLV